MTTTPIVEIPVDDSAFEKFAAAFDDYSEKLKDMPADWAALNARINEAAKLHKAVGASMDAAWTNATSAAAAYEAAVHGAAKAQTNLAATTTRSGTAMTRMAKEAKAVRDHVFGAVRFLAKFSAYGIGGGLVGAGGLAFGLDDLAGRVLATQRTSRGLGLTSGQYNSFMANMRPYAGAAALEGAANVRSGDPNAAVNVGVLGIGSINAAGMNSAQLVAAELIAIHRDWKANPTKNSPWWAAANAQGLSDDQIRVAASTHLSTLIAARNSMNSDAASMGFTNKVAREWTAFDIQLRKAGILIETALIGTLAPLTPQLTTLSRRIAGFIVGLEKSGEVKHWIDELDGGIKHLANALGYVADDTIAVAKWIEAHAPKSLNLKDIKAGAVAGGVTGLAAGGPVGAVAGAVAGATMGYVAGHPLKFGLPHNPLNLRSAPNAGSVTTTNAGKFAAFHSDAAGYKAAAWQLSRYPAEHHADTIGSIVPVWAPASDHNNVSRYVAEVAKWSGLKPGQKIDFHNQDQAARLVSAMARAESGIRISPAQVRKEIAASHWTASRPNTASAFAAPPVAYSPFAPAPAASPAGGGWSDVARVLKRIRAGQSHVHVTVHSPPGSRVYVSANAAAGAGA